jgi:hypothetical protein
LRRNTGQVSVKLSVIRHDFTLSATIRQNFTTNHYQMGRGNNVNNPRLFYREGKNAVGFCGGKRKLRP